MEDYLYMKGFSGPREWCSKKVVLKSYFEQYSLLLLQNGLPPKRATEVDILQHFVPQSNQLSEEELCSLMEITNASQLTDLTDLKKPTKGPKKGCVKKRSADNNKDKKKEFDNGSPSKSPQSARCFAAKKPNRISGTKRASRQDILLKDVTPKVGRQDLVANGNFVVSFRVHEPFKHREREWLRPGKCSQQMTLLDVQSLTHLKDMILCEADFQDVRGDISEQPGEAVNVRALDVYPSSMFYFDNTFYVDKRSAGHTDYSARIRDWAGRRGIPLGGTRSMEKTKVEDLTVRLGYPYVYVHQGDCEHLIMVSDARLLTADDSLHSSSYPLMTKVTSFNCMLCMSCAVHSARWIVRDCDRLSHDPTYQCDRCFFEFNYIDGKKVGKFKAYKFWQRSIL